MLNYEISVEFSRFGQGILLLGFLTLKVSKQTGFENDKEYQVFLILMVYD